MRTDRPIRRGKARRAHDLFRKRLVTGRDDRGGAATRITQPHLLQIGGGNGGELILAQRVLDHVEDDVRLCFRHFRGEFFIIRLERRQLDEVAPLAERLPDLLCGEDRILNLRGRLRIGVEMQNKNAHASIKPRLGALAQVSDGVSETNP